MIPRVSIALASLVLLPFGLAPLAAYPPPDHPVTGLIGAKYKELNGAAGPLGHPTSNEMDSKEGKGRFQNFEHGVIGVTPSTGPKSVQALYVKNADLIFEWGDTAPFNYDFFQVRWDLDGKNVGQQEIKGGPRTKGKWVSRPHSGGRYRLVVEGADGHVGGSKSRQGWSNPLYLDYVPPAPDYSYAPPAKQPAPVARKVAKNMPQGLYLREWMRLGGPDGPMGLPKSGVQPHTGSVKGGTIQFESGQISFCPGVWEKGVLGAYQNDGEIFVDWTVSWGEPNPPAHFNYDKFILRWDFNGKHYDGDQIDIEADDTHLRSRGLKHLAPNHGTGDYRIVVEGSDEHIVSKSKARQGWMQPVVVHFVKTPPSPTLDRHFTVDMTNIAPAITVREAKANFDRRVAAAILHNACQPLSHTIYKDEMNWSLCALAKMAYPDYFQSDRLPGHDDKVREEVIEALRRQTVGSKPGTTGDSFPTKRTGEYDVALTGLIALTYKYYHHLPVDVQDHIVNHLLNIRGPFNGDDTRPFKPAPIPETENHLMMIESARYLTNQLLFKREGDPQFDNARNGMDEWMLKHLQHFLLDDFIEYNARPYQNYSMSALLNLYTFTSAKNPSSARVKMAAHMVLDYLMAKVAVSSNDSRRSVTYRRHADDYSADFMSGNFDPQNAFSMLFAGTTDMVGKTTLPSSYAWAFQWGGLSDYRLPDAVLDLMVERSHRTFFQRFHHAADEAYASSPSYLISSGGHYASFAYPILGKGKHDDIGLALPTSFMPTGQFKSANDLIRFAGASSDEKRSNMGVTADFACGLNPIIPPAYAAAAVSVDQSGKRTPRNVKIEPWTFIDQSTAKVGAVFASKPQSHGYYVAVYHRGGLGFLEAYDTALHSSLKFEDFMAGVLKRNGATSFKTTGKNSYVMTDGKSVVFEISPNSIVDLPAEKPFFVKGSILNGPEKAGVITIDNPTIHKRITLDMHDWKAPRRAEN